jgi:aryl-alcohol dehydrogenase-like predicted oxidoreductase
MANDDEIALKKDEFRVESVELGKDGPLVTPICFGCWSMGGAWRFGWADIDDDESIAAIHKALDLGIDFFDSAAVYGLGHAEVVLARALGSRRKEVLIATKCGVWWFEDERGFHRNSLPAQIKRECEESLRRLRTDYIDLYQIHWPDDEVPCDESMKALLDLVEEGKVRHVGVCNYSVGQMRESMKAGIGVMAYSPLASGILAGHYTQATTFGEGDWRNDDPAFQDEQFKSHLRKVDHLESIARKYDKTMAQLAIAWVLRHPAVDVAIVGMKRPSHVEGAVGAIGWGIADEDMALIDGILAAS